MTVGSTDNLSIRIGTGPEDTDISSAIHPLRVSKAFSITSGVVGSMVSGSSPSRAFLQSLKEEYSTRNGKQDEDLIEAFDKFAQNSVNLSGNLDAILRDLVKTTHRLFEFEYIAVALRSKKDGLYRYVVTYGLSPQTDSSYKQIAYSTDDLFNNADFPSVKVCKFTHFYLAESKPYRPGEENSFTRPNLLSQVRVNTDDMLEGDYIDVYMLGPSDEVLGYLELAGTRSGKLPERKTIKWMELAALYISKLIQKENGGTAWQLQLPRLAR
jgi:hypothetical protein